MTASVGQYQRHLNEFANGNLGSTFTIDLLANGIYQSGVLNSASCTITFSPPRVHSYLFLELIQDATGGRSVTFAGPVLVPTPALNTAANASTLLTMLWNGTNYQFISTPATGTAGVTTFNSRSGTVVPVAGDYPASKITNDSSTVAGAEVSNALDNLRALIASTGVSSFNTRTGAVVPVSGDYAASLVNNDSTTVPGTHVSNALDNLAKPFHNKLHVDPTYSGTSTGTESQPYTSITAAFAAAATLSWTSGLIEMAPGSVSTENVTFPPAAGTWEISCESLIGAAITGNLIISGTGTAQVLRTVRNISVSGTITGTTAATSGSFFKLFNSVISGAVTLSQTGSGSWFTILDGPGSPFFGFNGGLLSSLTSSEFFAANYYLGNVTFTSASSLFGCRMTGSSIGIGGGLSIQNTFFQVAPTFTGSAIVTMDGFSHASAVAAGGITLAGGATIAILNDVNPSGIQQAGATSGQALAWNGSAYVPTSIAGSVTSVFGRSGAVVATSGDYPASKITNDSSVAGTTTKDALNTLLAGSGVNSVFGRNGTVVAVAGDYAASKITNDSATVPGTHVSDSLDNLLLTYQSAPTVTAGRAIALTDVGTAILANSSGSLTFTIPANATTAFKIGSRVTIINISNGTIVISPAAGVTLQQGSAFPGAPLTSYTLDKIGTNTWQVTAQGVLDAINITDSGSTLGGPTVRDSINALASLTTALLNEYPRGTYNITGDITLDLTTIGKLGLVTAPGPGGADVDIPLGGTVGAKYDLLLMASGSDVSTSGAAGVTVHNPAFQTIQYTKVSLTCVATNEWVVSYIPLVPAVLSGSFVAVPIIPFLNTGFSGGLTDDFRGTNAGGNMGISLPLYPNVALRQINLTIEPNTGHGGVLPSGMPFFQVWTSSTFAHATAGLVGSVVDASANATIYEASHTLQFTFGTPLTTINALNTWLRINDESGGVSGLRLKSITAVYS